MASGIVAIYGGRFHPFHKGHKAVYDGLAKKFGEKNTFICTSDKTGPGSPFTFKEKRAMMLLAGVPGYAIKQEVSPYRPENTLSTVSEDTAVLFAVGLKDMAENPRFKPGLKKDGTATYYQDLDAWLKAGKKLEPFEKHGYLITIPSVKFTVLGNPADSATQLRAQYKTLDDEKRKEFITDLFGAYDEVIQQVMDKRLAETTEGDMTADKKNPVAKKHIDKPEWKALHDMDDDIINDYIKHKAVTEDSPWELLKRKLDPKLHHKRYQRAAEVLHSVLKRKEKENAGKPFRHALGYYAQTIGQSFANSNIDTKALIKYYLDNFDPVMTEELVTPDSPNDEDGKLTGGASPQMIAKMLPGVKDKVQLLQVLMKMKRGDTQYSRNQMIAAADAFKEIIAKNPEETQKIMMLLKKVKAESTYQFENINFDTA
jgi:cytidyltransferase-like protein